MFSLHIHAIDIFLVKSSKGFLKTPRILQASKSFKQQTFKEELTKKRHKMVKAFQSKLKLNQK